MYAVIVIDQRKGGLFEDVRVFKERVSAVDFVVAQAWEDGYLGADDISEADLRQELMAHGGYTDGDVYTSIEEVVMEGQ